MDHVNSILVKLWNDVLCNPVPRKVSNLWKEHVHIYEKMSLVINAQEPFQRPDRYANIDNFLIWAKNMNIEHVNVEIINTEDNGLSLKASSNFNYDELIIRVPHKVILSLDHVDNALKIIFDDDELIKNMDNVALVIILANEILKGKNSQWAPYFNVLPSKMHTIMFFSLDNFQNLKSSPAFDEALRMYRAITRQYVYFYLRISGAKSIVKNKSRKMEEVPFSTTLFTLKNFSFEFYRWCVSVVSTRINMLPLGSYGHNGKRMVPALIPFIDFANHGNSDNNSGFLYFDAELKMSIFQIKKSITCEKELFVSYGTRINQNFLFHNGFVPAFDNIHNTYQLRIGLPITDRLKHNHLFRLGIFPDANCSTEKSYVYQFELKSRKVDNLTIQLLSTAKCEKNNAKISTLLSSVVDDLPKLWEFAITFVNNFENKQTLNKLLSEEFSNVSLNEKAKSFLVDRLTILLLNYSNVDVSTNLEEKKTLLDNKIQLYIWRLKKYEKEILISNRNALTALII